MSDKVRPGFGTYTHEETHDVMVEALSFLDRSVWKGEDHTCISCGEPSFVGHDPECELNRFLHRHDRGFYERQEW